LITSSSNSFSCMLFSGSIKLGFDKFLTILMLSSKAGAN
jgi:hypothetical protein